MHDTNTISRILLKKTMTTKLIDVTPGTYNLKDLAGFYKVCTKTMRKQIASISELLPDRTGRRLYWVNEVEIIFKIYGVPKIKIMVSENEKERNVA